MRKIEDHYARRAREQGYLARSVYKLQEMQEKYKIIRKGIRVLDLGAAPGSWSQYVLNVTKGNGLVVGVDLKNIHMRSRYLTRFKGIQGSFKHEGVLAQIKELGPYQLIMSDAAPSTSGDRFVDAHNSAALVENVLEIANDHLRPGGNLVVKIFQGGDEMEIYQKIKKRFERSKSFKPKASRNESIEIFYLGFGYRGPGCMAEQRSEAE